MSKIVRNYKVVTLAQLGERQTEALTQSFYLKVLCSIHISHMMLIITSANRGIFFDHFWLRNEGGRPD